MTGKFAPVYPVNYRFAPATDAARRGAKMTDRCVPIYPVELQRDPRGDTVVFVYPCPICGTKHTHGTDPAMLAGKPSHRVAHCPDPESRPRRYRETGRHPWGYSLYLKPQK
jgi:hypothetical protein